MDKKVGLIIGAVAIVVIIGAVFLYTVDIPAPSEPVEKTLSDDRFPR